MSHSYQINEDQFVRACRHAHAPRRRWLALAMFVVLAWFPVAVGVSPQSLIATGIVGVLLVAFLWLVLPPLQRWQLRRIYRSNPLLQREQQVEMQPVGFVLRSDNGESRYDFRELKRVVVMEDMVLVYPTTTIFHMIPTVLLSDFELAQFRALS